MKPLGERLGDWGAEKGWRLGLCVVQDEGANYGRVAANMGPTTGFGHTTNEAINNLADGLVEEGWPDDRCPDPEDDDDFWIDDRPIIGRCSVCGEAREDDYTCRHGGSTVPLEANDG